MSIGLVRVQVVEPPAEAPPPDRGEGHRLPAPGRAARRCPCSRTTSRRRAACSPCSPPTTPRPTTSSRSRSSRTPWPASRRPRRSIAQLQFSYTISDGVNTATATVTVVPVPPLVKHQPPVAVDDAVNVRAGDIATVPVLDNDYHPDSTAIHVLPELADTGALQRARLRRRRPRALPGARASPARTRPCTRSATTSSRPRART